MSLFSQSEYLSVFSSIDLSQILYQNIQLGSVCLSFFLSVSLAGYPSVYSFNNLSICFSCKNYINQKTWVRTSLLWIWQVTYRVTWLYIVYWGPIIQKSHKFVDNTTDVNLPWTLIKMILVSVSIQDQSNLLWH